MHDQADKLRRLVQATVADHPVLEPGVPLVAVHGACAGVGSTTVALRLAQQLHQLGKRIVLVDADLNAPQLAPLMGLDLHEGLGEVLAGQRAAAEVVENVGENFHLLAGTVGMPPELNHRALRRFVTELRALSKLADLVVLDVGTTMSPWVERLWTSAVQILLVTRSESTSLMEAYSAVKSVPWGDVDGKLRLVVNRCDNPAQGHKVSEGFASTCKQFLGMKLLGEAAVLGTDARLLAGDRRQTGSSPLQAPTRLLAADVLSHVCTIHTRYGARNSSTLQRGSQAAGLFDSLVQSLKLAD